MKCVSLFSGIGGIDLALSKAGMKILAHSEIDQESERVLSGRFPASNSLGDVRNIQVLPRADVITAGFPCQDLSMVGKRSGIHGTRSGLVSELFRLLRGHEANWVLLENVGNLRSIDGGAAFRWLLRQLDELELRWAYRTIDSMAFGVPQRRRRIYILASRSGDPRSILFNGDHPEQRRVAPPVPSANGFYWTEGNTGLGWVEDGVPTLKSVSKVGIGAPPAIIRASGEIIIPDIRDAERLQGFPADWTKAAEHDGMSRGARWRMVGNAVTVNVVEWIGRRIMKNVEGYSPTAQRDQELTTTAGTMPRAAWSMNTGRWYETDLSTWPVRRHSSLEAFLRYEGTPLSLRAARGFNTRITRSNLRKPPGLMEALAAHVLRFS